MSGGLRRNLVVVTLLALVAALALAFALTRGGDKDGAKAEPSHSASASTTGGRPPPGPAAETAARPDWVPARMRVVAPASLPVQARDTLRLIAAGGPYPYPRDGIVFGNREKLLPSKPDGHYREYTVRTPGSADRGARRIVTGKNAERYYSDDHYASFSAVLP